MNSQIFCIGVINLDRTLLERHAVKRNRVNVRVIGRLDLSPDVTPELVRQTVKHVFLKGTMTGPAEAVAALREKVG